MPNYSLIINSTFRPFSYQELLQPALMATEAQHNLEDQYADLESKASIWEGMANEQTDPRTYKRYKDYADELQAAANDLADYGLTPSSRQKMANMRARYSSQILPIQNAYQTRLEQAKEQRQALNQNPTLMLSRRAATTSLDEYMDNPMLDYESYSGAMLTKQVAQMADKLKGELTSYGSKPLDKFTNLFLQKHGLSSNEVLNAINNPKAGGSAKVLNAMVNDAIESSGMKGWADDATMKQAYKYAWQGAWNAIGQTTASPYENKQAVMDYDFAQKKALMDYEYKKKREGAEAEAADKSPRLSPLALRNQEEVDAANTSVDNYIKEGYLKRNSHGLVLTTKGRNALVAASYSPTEWKKRHPKSGLADYHKYLHKYLDYGKRHKDISYASLSHSGRLFASWYNSKIGGFSIKDWGQSTVSTPTTRLNAYVSSHRQGSYDTYHSTEYDRQIDPGDYSTAVTQQLWSAAANGKLEQVYFGKDSKGNRGFVTKKKLSGSDLKKYKVTNIRYSKYGNTAILQNDDNDVVRVRIPKGIHLASESRVSSAISYADTYGEILHKGLQPKLRSNGDVVRDRNGNIQYTNTPLSNADRVVIERNQRDALDEMNSFGAQLFVPSTTETEKYGDLSY